jgi:hypothetical protein
LLAGKVADGGPAYGERMRRTGNWIPALIFTVVLPGVAQAHCDTEDGPVVAAARAALAAGDPAAALAWVQPAQEEAVRRAFASAVEVRAASPAARELADRYFFETLVRLHREGEGFPYTGVRPPGAPVAPAIRAADAALASGEIEPLVHELTAALSAGVHQRLAHARDTRAHAGESVEAGRRFVAAYVELTHYVERLEGAAAGGGGHADGAPAHAGHPGH